MFLGVVLAQVQLFGTGTRQDVQILHQCGKWVKTKIQKDFELVPTFVTVREKILIIN